jgi:hypothetical protein
MLSPAVAETGHMTTRYERVLGARAVPPELVFGDWGERYLEFEQGDWDTFRTLHSHPEPFHRRIVSQSGGYIVNRWDITGARIVPYIRPDKPVILDPRKDPTKYLQPSLNHPGQARRLEVHPSIRERLLKNREEPIYLCLEGCLKADAVVGTGRLAISVPSVTCWRLEDEHLKPWLPILRQAPIVYVVPDSDYHPKRVGYVPGDAPVFVNEGQVRFFTDKCAVHYRSERGLRLAYMVPPYLTRKEALSRGLDSGQRWKIGIDDHIAWKKNWDPWDLDTNPDGLHYFEYGRGAYRRLPPKPGAYRTTDDRDREFLGHLEATRGTVGLFSVQDVAQELNWPRAKVWRAKTSCIARGVLQVWDGKPLGEEKGNNPHVFRFGQPYEIKDDREPPQTSNTNEDGHSRNGSKDNVAVGPRTVTLGRF